MIPIPILPMPSTQFDVEVVVEASPECTYFQGPCPPECKGAAYCARYKAEEKQVEENLQKTLQFD